MSEVKTISFRIPTDKVESLDELAESMDRDRSHVLNEAVENYLRLNEHHIKLIKKGLRAAEEGSSARTEEESGLARTIAAGTAARAISEKSLS